MGAEGCRKSGINERIPEPLAAGDGSAQEYATLSLRKSETLPLTTLRSGRMRPLFAALAAGVVTLPAVAAVNDVMPTDYVALPGGATNLSLYALQQRQSGPWRDGRQAKSWGGRSSIVRAAIAGRAATADQSVTGIRNDTVFQIGIAKSSDQLGR